jgi:hypothetical protein
MRFSRIDYPKIGTTAQFLTNFREVNKRIVRTPLMIPNIHSILKEMEGFTFATAIYLNMA